VKDEPSSGAAQDGSAGEDLSAKSGRFAIARQLGGALELGESVKQEQDGPKRCFGGAELLEAESVGTQVMLEFGDTVLPVGAQIVVTPDFLGCFGMGSDKHPKNGAGNIDQLAAYTVAAFAHDFANHHEAAFCLPTQQRQAELPHRISLIERPPLLHVLRFPLAPWGEARDYKVGQTALFQKAPQLVIEESRVGSYQADLLALSPPRESFFEKLHHPTCWSAVAAAEPAVQEPVSFGQNSQQGMMRRAPVLARIMSLQRSFLSALALEYRGVQVQRVALAAERHAFHLPWRQRFEQALHIAPRETPEQIADRIVGGEAVDP
jgi:hypothetical protein